MLDAFLIFVSGMLGSSHCLGMCGGFVMTIGAAAPTAGTNFVRQAVYSAGRIFTYVFLGAVCGFGGRQLLHSPWSRGAQAALALAAGALLIVQGMKTLGYGRFLVPSTGNGCAEARVFAALLASPKLQHSFGAGLLTGFLPCGLTFAFLSLSMSAASPFSGMTIMALFGLGTVPAMIVAGCAFGLVSLGLRRRVFAVAGACVVATGVLSMIRGGVSLADGSTRPCPFCVVGGR